MTAERDPAFDLKTWLELHFEELVSNTEWRQDEFDLPEGFEMPCLQNFSDFRDVKFQKREVGDGGHESIRATFKAACELGALVAWGDMEKLAGAYHFPIPPPDPESPDGPVFTPASVVCEVSMTVVGGACRTADVDFVIQELRTIFDEQARVAECGTCPSKDVR